MYQHKAGKKKLSKNLLEMKFMKRTKERTEREEEDEQRKAMFGHDISDAMKHQGSRFVLDPSYASVENLIFGRSSYHGMNPEIEQIMRDERERKKKRSLSVGTPSDEVEVTDQEMASTLSKTVARKFATKRAHPKEPPTMAASTSANRHLLNHGHGKVKQRKAV